MTKIKEWFREYQIVIIIPLIFASVIKGSMLLGEVVRNKNQEWKNSACPPLFSIARSARDTLIVMKSHTSCNYYIMENLK
jgi:hypothetical protein